MQASNDFYVYRKATVTKIIDGDTVDLVVDLGFSISVEVRIRFADIDAYELRGEGRPLGLLAKEAVQKAIPVGSEVELHTLKSKGSTKDKQGTFYRYLGVIWVTNRDGTGQYSLNEYLVEAGLAVRYYEG